MFVITQADALAMSGLFWTCGPGGLKDDQGFICGSFVRLKADGGLTLKPARHSQLTQANTSPWFYSKCDLNQLNTVRKSKACFHRVYPCVRCVRRAVDRQY